VKLLSVLALFAAISLAQTTDLPQRRVLETAASRSGAQIIWSIPAGSLEGGELRAVFTVLAVVDSAHAGQQIRGIRVDLAQKDWKGVVHVDEDDVAVLKNGVDSLAKRQADFAKKRSSPTLTTRAPEDNQLRPLYFGYGRTLDDATLYLGGAGVPQFRFKSPTPADLAAVFSRVAQELSKP
jgi:hypothetical protein